MLLIPIKFVSSLKRLVTLLQLTTCLDKSNNVEIEERSLKNLSQKLQHKLIDGAYLAHHNSKQVTSLLGWLTKRINTCTPQGFLSCVSILKHISLKQEGKILLRSNGCAELLYELIRQVSDPHIQTEMDETMKNLVQDSTELLSSGVSVNKQEFPKDNASHKLTMMHGVTSSQIFSQIPEREEDPSFFERSTIHNPFQHSTFKKNEMASSQQPVVKTEYNYLETMHKQQQLKEVCELPYVMLSDEDEKVLFDLSVQLKFGDFKNILASSHKLMHQSFYDYPLEVFLQRTDIVRALIDLLEGSSHGSTNVYTNLAQPALLVFVQRLRNLYVFHCNNVNKVSHMSISNDRDAKQSQELHIQHCYPCNHNGRWQTLEENSDANKYGSLYRGGPKVSNMTAACLQNSLSCKAALGLILTKTIYLLKDTEKIGLYIQLIQETLDSMISIFRVEHNAEFSEILHLCLFAFDSVFDFYKDSVFDDVLTQPILIAAIRFITLLNTIPTGESNKYKHPFTECLQQNTLNLQRTLRRSLFKCFFETPQQKEDSQNLEVIKFFEKLQMEVPTVGSLQRNVTQSFTRAQDSYQKYTAVQSFKIHAEGLIQNEDSGIVFIQSLTQYYQSLDILEVLLQCLQMRLDFPFEHLLTDCIMYGILASESNLDPKLEQLDRLFIAFLSIPLPEVRERILRKLYSKLRLQSSLSINQKSLNNITLLSKFIYRKNIMQQLINGMLINAEVSSEETRLQINVGTVIIKVLIIAYNEGGQICQKHNLNSHFLTFHSMIRKFPDVIGLLDLIEENSSTKSLRFHRLLRDLFNQDSQKREFATSVLRNNFSKDSQEYKDIIAESFDLKRPSIETSLELESINQNYDSSAFDIMNIQSILMSSGSDYMIKKTCLEQLTLILFDVTSKRGKQLFSGHVSTGARDLFAFLVYEIVASYNTCQGYLRQQASLLDLNQQTFISECFRFIFYSAILYSDEPEIKGFFNKLRQLYQPKDKQDQDMQAYEQFLTASVFFSGSTVMKNNALKAIFITVFHPVILNTKISKQQLPNGSFKKNLQVMIGEFCCNAFIIIVPYHSQQLKQAQRDDLILSDEEVMYISHVLAQQQRNSRDSIQLKEVTALFISKVHDKNENFNNVMRGLEQLQNYILSIQQMRDELINQESLNCMVELLKTLPTRDFEYSFFADYFMILSQILQSHKSFTHVSNLQLFVNRLCDGLKHHLLPFLIESGFAIFGDIESSFSPKIYFIQRFIELINNLMQADLYLQQQHRMSSGVQDRILCNSQFVEYMIDLYSIFKASQTENKRKIQLFLSIFISSFDTRHIKFDRVTELLMNSIATHKMTLLLADHSALMLSIRTLMLIHQRRLTSVRQNIDNLEDLSVSLNPSSVAHLQKFTSCGWIIRFIECRDSRIRVLAWDLITEMFDYEFLKSNPSIVQSALNTYLKHQELFSVKISALKFLSKVCDSLMQNCNVFSDFEESLGDRDILDSTNLGSKTEQMTVQQLLQIIAKQGLISQMHFMLSQKDTPLLFVTLTIKLLHKLVQMDHKRALPVLTQLDYWTFLVEMLQPQQLEELEMNENRLILKELMKNVLRTNNPCTNKDMIVLVVNAILEFIFEGFKRDAQLANMLVKTTKLMNNVFQTLKCIIDSVNDKSMKLVNKNLLIIFFDKVVKLLHIALMHPRECTVEMIKKFLYEERRTEQQRNWIYITEMFRIINEMASSCSYLYGQIEVKLALSRFIAEFLIRVDEPNHLDEMATSFDGKRYFDENEVFTREEMRTYGSLILLEMGMVFKGLYIDKNQRAANGRPTMGDFADNENSKIDITTCLCILLAKCNSAKTVSIEQNLAKKILEICQENVSALHLADIQKLTNKGGNNNKSVIGGSVNNSTLIQSVFESQIKRQYKYAQVADVELCERESIRMLQLLRHIFFQSGDLLTNLVVAQDQTSSKLIGNQTKKVVKSSTIGEQLINQWAQIIEDLGNNDRYIEIIHESLRGAITFASQNARFKNLFAVNSLPTATVKRNSLLKLCSDKLLNESLQGNSQRMKFFFILMRSLSMSSEIAKELMKLHTVEDLLAKILPVCKNEKDIRMMRNYLSYFSTFIAGYSSTEEGQKNILKLKDLYELSLFVLDTITLHQTSQSAENKCLVNVVTHNLLFLRNTAFHRSNKLHFISNPQFLPCLFAFLSSQQMQQTSIKAYAAACLWIVLYNHQGIKAALNRPEILNEIQLLRQEYQRQCDIENYQHYVDTTQQVPHQLNTNYLLPQNDKDHESNANKKMNEFTLTALNGILGLLQQA